LTAVAREAATVEAAAALLLIDELAGLAGRRAASMC
jgi:hypothetical protein